MNSQIGLKAHSHVSRILYMILIYDMIYIYTHTFKTDCTHSLASAIVAHSVKTLEGLGCQFVSFTLWPENLQ